jgi:hypothetical protein
LAEISGDPAAGDENPVLLSSLDPALPFGPGFDWGRSRQQEKRFKIARSAANHLVLADGRIAVVCENFFQRLTVLSRLSSRKWQAVASMFAEYLKMPSPVRPVSRIAIHEINGLPAAESPMAPQLTSSGFEKDGGSLILWPSAV